MGRNQTADLLKGFAVICMIQVHLTEIFALDNIYNNLYGHISLFFGGPPAAPLFMGVMGYYLYKSRKPLDFQIARGFLLFAGGILLNLALNFHILYLIFSGKQELDPYKFILGADILPLAGMSVIIIAVMKHYILGVKKDSEELGAQGRKNSITGILLFAIVAVISAFIAPYINSVHLIHPYIQAFLWGEISWSYFPLFPWLFYPMSGFIFGYLIESKLVTINNKPVIILLLVIILLVAIIFFRSGFAISYNLHDYYHHGLWFALWAACLVLIIVTLFYYIDKMAGNSFFFRYIKWIGKNVTAFYVVQWIIIGNLGTALYKTQGYNELIFWFIAITLGTSVLVLIFNKSKSSLSTNSRNQAEIQQ